MTLFRPLSSLSRAKTRQPAEQQLGRLPLGIFALGECSSLSSSEVWRYMAAF